MYKDFNESLIHRLMKRKIMKLDPANTVSEVKIGDRRADIVYTVPKGWGDWPDSIVIEIQCSPISLGDLIIRTENFIYLSYPTVWLFDFKQFIKIKTRVSIRGQMYYTIYKTDLMAFFEKLEIPFLTFGNDLFLKRNLLTEYITTSPKWAKGAGDVCNNTFFFSYRNYPLDFFHDYFEHYHKAFDTHNFLYEPILKHFPKFINFINLRDHFE